MVAAHLTQLKDDPLPQGERSFFAFGATIVAGEEGRSPYVHQGQAYVHLYSSNSDRIANLPPPPPQTQVIAARDHLFFERGSGGSIPPEFLQVPRNTPFIDQPVARGIIVEPVLVPEVPITKEEITNIEIAMAKLKALTNEEDPSPQNSKTTQETEPGGEETISSALGQNTNQNDLAWTGGGCVQGAWNNLPTVNTMETAMDVEGVQSVPARVNGQLVPNETPKTSLTFDAPPITVLETAPDSPPALYYPEEIQVDELAGDDEPMPDAPKLVSGEATVNKSAPELQEVDNQDDYLSYALVLARRSRPSGPLDENDSEIRERLCENVLLIAQYLAFCIGNNLHEETRNCLKGMGLQEVVTEMREEIRKGKPERADYWAMRIGRTLEEKQQDVENYMWKLYARGIIVDYDEEEEEAPPKPTAKKDPCENPESASNTVKEETRTKIATTVLKVLDSRPKPPPVVNETAVATARIKSNLEYLGKFIQHPGRERLDAFEGLAEMGLLQIAYDIGDLKEKGIVPDGEYWGRKAAEAMEERKEQIEAYLAKTGRQAWTVPKRAKSSLPQIKEEPEEIDVKEEAPINWYPNVTAYVPASPANGEPEEPQYVPRSPDPGEQHARDPRLIAEERGWEETHQRITALEGQMDEAVTMLKTRMHELETQAFEDGCLLTELNWKADELKKMENKARADKKRTHRRNDPKTQHRYQTRSVTAASEVTIAEIKKKAAKVADRILTIEIKVETATTEIKSIKSKLDKISTIESELKKLAKIVEEQRKSQQDMNSVLMSEIASLKLSLGPTLESKIKTQSIEIDHLTSRVNQLHQVAMTLLTSADQYASTYATNYVNPYADPYAKSISAF